MNKMLPSWRKYEKDIFAHYNFLYPNCDITFDTKIRGKESGSLRQIDILIKGSIAGFRINIAIDCKNYRRKIDIKVVEAFLELMKDINCNNGILISQRGFTKSAHNRAEKDQANVDLRILNFEELIGFKGFGFIAYNLPYGVFIPVPESWSFVNGYPIPEPAMCAFLFPTELGIEECFKKQNFMVIKLPIKKDDLTLTNLLKVHESQSISSNDKNETTYAKIQCKNEALSCILSNTVAKGSSSCSLALYIEYANFILYVQVLSSLQNTEKDSLVLRYIANIAFPLQVNISANNNPILAENGHALIKDPESLYRAITNRKTKSGLLTFKIDRGRKE